MTHSTSRLFGSLVIASALLPVPRSSIACFVTADREETVAADLGAAGSAEVKIRWYRDAEGLRCTAYAVIAESRNVSSHRTVLSIRSRSLKSCSTRAVIESVSMSS